MKDHRFLSEEITPSTDVGADWGIFPFPQNLVYLQTMTSTTTISNTTFRETIDRAVKDVFSTMLSQKAVPNPFVSGVETDGAPLVKGLSIPGIHIIGTVGFVGDLNGLLSLYFEERLALAAACQMLGMSPEEVKETGPEVVNDTIGELTNMTAGTFKNQFADRGFPCKLTIPSLLKGEGLLLEPSKGSARRIYRYDISSSFVFVDFQLKEGSA